MNGIRTLEDLRDRCRVDESTGCWIWSGAMSKNASGKTPVTWYPPLARTVTVIRAVWHLRGVEMSPREVGWVSCFQEGCCSPDHGRYGTRVQLGAAISANGHRKGASAYRIGARKPRRTHLPHHKRAAVLSSTESGTVLAGRLEISESAVSRLRRGVSYRSGFDVFSLKLAA